ncbi:MAG TPA: hypothetical protein VI462_12710, partial [Acidimicrobiia bacterium]
MADPDGVVVVVVLVVVGAGEVVLVVDVLVVGLGGGLPTFEIGLVGGGGGGGGAGEGPQAPAATARTATRPPSATRVRRLHSLMGPMPGSRVVASHGVLDGPLGGLDGKSHGG